MAFVVLIQDLNFPSLGVDIQLQDLSKECCEYMWTATDCEMHTVKSRR